MRLLSTEAQTLYIFIFLITKGCKRRDNSFELKLFLAKHSVVFETSLSGQGRTFWKLQAALKRRVTSSENLPGSFKSDTDH